METKEIIKELEEEIKALDFKIIKIRNVINNLQELESPTREIKKVNNNSEPKKRKRATNSEVEQKKKQVQALLEEGNLTKEEIAKKVGVHKSSIYNWFKAKDFSSKKKDGWSSNKRKKKHLCEDCHERTWSSWYNGKQLCQRCFDLKRKGEISVKKREKYDPDAYDESSFDIDDEALEDDE